jgi:hypothetical protein
MKKQNLYHIRIQRWINGPTEILVWPKTFPTYDEAYTFMTECFTFKDIADRKASACVELCR